MTPPIFHLDDEVETANGTRFKISQIWKRTDGSFAYSGPNRRWFPADDLRLVPDELKIGDLVEVVGSPKYFPQYPAKTVFCITKGPLECKGILGFGGIRNCVDCYCGDGTPFYPPASLRKLTPAEVAEHTSTFTQECQATLDKAEEALRRVLAPSVDKRLSAIEKQLEEQQKKISQFDGEIAHLIGSIQECLMESGDVEARTKCREMKIEKRLAFVEKFQRDQSDLVGRAIRDGVVEISDFRRKA
jgi:hypothetical protein